MQLATDFLHYYEMNWAMVSDLRYYSENQEHCDTEEPFFMFEQWTQKVECDEVKEYFYGQYVELVNLAYSISWECDDVYNTNSLWLCSKRVERELTKLSENAPIK